VKPGLNLLQIEKGLGGGGGGEKKIKKKQIKPGGKKSLTFNINKK